MRQRVRRKRSRPTGGSELDRNTPNQNGEFMLGQLGATATTDQPPADQPELLNGVDHASFPQEVFTRASNGDRFAAEIVARWAAEGDADTWAWLLGESERLASILLYRATGKRNGELVEDVAQSAVTDVFQMLSENRFDFDRAHRYRGLLRVIISRTIAKVVVRRARESRRNENYAGVVAAQIASASLTPGERARTGIDRSAVERAISAIPEPERTAVLLHARGMTLDQIGEQIGYRSRSGVRKVLRRGLESALDLIENDKEWGQGGAGSDTRNGTIDGGGS